MPALSYNTFIYTHTIFLYRYYFCLHSVTFNILIAIPPPFPFLFPSTTETQQTSTLIIQR